MKSSRKIPVVLLAILALLAPGVGGTRAETPDEIYAFASRLQKDGMFEAAAQQFLRFTGDSPSDLRVPEALASAADCLVKADNTARAVSVLETLTSTYPDHPDRCRFALSLGRLYYKLERYTDADRVFTRIMVEMTDCPEVPDAMLGKGESLISGTQYRAAIDVLGKVLERFERSEAAPRAAYNVAFCQRKLGNEGAALATYARVVSDYPRDPLAGFSALEAARIYAARGSVDEAAGMYARAWDFGASVIAIPAGGEVAALLARDGRSDEALVWYEKLLARGKDVDDLRTIYVNAVSAAWNAGDNGAVLRLAKEYETAFPGTFAPQVTYARARASLKRGDTEAALRDADQLESLARGTAWGQSAHRVRAEALLARADARGAVASFARFVDVSADSTSRCEVLRRIADLSFTVTRDTTAAVEALRRLLDIELRRVPSEMIRVAARLEEARRYGASRSVYGEVLRRFPLSAEAEEAEARVAWLDEFTVADFRESLRALDRRAWKIAADRSMGLIDLADARIEITRDFGGALRVCQALKKNAKGDVRARVLYLEGLAWSKMARRESGRAGKKNDGRVQKFTRNAEKAWRSLAKEFPSAGVAADAAFESFFLRAAAGSRVDESGAEALLKRHPKHPASGRVLVLMARAVAKAGDDASQAAATAYLKRAAALTPEDGSVRLEYGRALAQQKDYRAAVDVFQPLLDGGDPRVGLRAAYESARAHQALGNYRDAVPLYDRVAKADAYGAWGTSAAVLAADCFYLRKQYEEALARYETAARRAGEGQRGWDVVWRRALCLKQMHRDTEALDKMKECLDSPLGGSERGRVYERAAEVAARLGRPAEETAILKRWIDEVGVTKATGAGARRLIRAFLRDGNDAAALGLAGRLVDFVGREDAEAGGLYAMTLLRAGRGKEAESIRARIAKQNGPDTSILQEIGVETARVLYADQKFSGAADAIRPYAESCRGEGACEEARFLYAMSLLGAREIEKGAAASRVFFRDYPVSDRGAALHLRLGNALVSQNRVTEAIIHYEEASHATADSASAFIGMQNLASSYQKLKRWKDAEAVWTRVVEKFPESEKRGEAALNAARCRMEQGKYAGAIAAYTEAMPLLDNEARARAYYWMGQSYEQLGDYSSAVVEYLKVPYLASGTGMWIVTARLKAAECYRKLGRASAAREIYEKVLRAHGENSNWGRVARKALDEIDAAGSEPGDGGQR